jgi:hypothetical protein
VELKELFNLYWRRIIPLGQTSSIAFGQQVKASLERLGLAVTRECELRELLN